MHCTYRDGSELPPEDVEAIRDVVLDNMVIESWRLGAALAQIQKDQQERDRQHLANRNLTLRQKARIRAAREQADAAVPA